ncbi:MAG: MFS transporter [Acidobacteria bacterium]|nr:MFS transporter [Acidobacteriota bacterium]
MKTRIFVITWLSYAGFYFCRKNFSVLMPLLARDEGFSSDQLANALFIYSVFYAVGQLSSGLMSDWLGPRRVVSAGMLVSAMATALMGEANSLWELTLLQGVNGFAQACGWPGLLKLMANWFEGRTRGLTMSLWGTNMVLGGFFATVFATWAATGPLMLALGWRRGLWWPAMVLGVLAVIFALVARDRPADLVEAAGPRRGQWQGLGEVLRTKAILVITGMYFTVKLARYVFLFWLPLYMTQRLGYPAAEAGYTSSIFELVGFTGVILAGFLSDRVARGRRFPVGALMMFALAVLCLIHPALASLGRWGNIVGIALIGMMTFGPDTLMAGAGVQDSVRREVTATAGGFTNAVGSLGQIVSPFVASMVSTRFGWDAVFYLLVVVAAAGGGILATQWNFRREEACSNMTSPSSAVASSV